jgi:hypothetical protein
MLRLCSESSCSYPGRSVRHAFALCESALRGNMQGDRTEVSSGHSRCRKLPLAEWRLKTSRDPQRGGYHGGLIPLKGQTRRTVALTMSSDML